MRYLDGRNRKSNVEATVTVLQKDGSEYTSGTGDEDGVNIGIPYSAHCSVLHTHPGDFSFSAQDWYQILGYDNVVQDHVIGPTRTFSLHKPKGWKAFDITTDEFNSERDQIIEDILSRAEEGNKILSNGDLAHEYSQTMAKKYGILYRVGIHKKRGK